MPIWIQWACKLLERQSPYLKLFCFIFDDTTVASVKLTRETRMCLWLFIHPAWHNHKKVERRIRWICFDVYVPGVLTVPLNEWTNSLPSFPSGARDNANWILTYFSWQKKSHIGACGPQFTELALGSQSGSPWEWLVFWRPKKNNFWSSSVRLIFGVGLTLGMQFSCQTFISDTSTSVLNDLRMI